MPLPKTQSTIFLKLLLNKENNLTPFERRALKVVLTIPLGQTRSYAWVAQKAGRPKAMRAVGQALRKNPYLILIPCHRVIRSDGSLGGYALGACQKKALLALEGRIAVQFSKK